MTTHPQIIRADESKEYFFEEGCYILELSNSPDDPTLSIARARLTPNTETQLHQLAHTIERYIILEGQGEVNLGNTSSSTQQSSIDTYPVSVGDVVLIPADCPQSIRNSGTGDLIFLVVCTPRFLPDNYRNS